MLPNFPPEYERTVTAGLSIFMPLQNATQSPYFGLQGGPRQSVPCLFHNLLASRSSVCCPHQFLCSHSRHDPASTPAFAPALLPAGRPPPHPGHPRGPLLLSFILGSKVTSAERPSQTASIKLHPVTPCLFNLLKFSS